MGVGLGAIAVGVVATVATGGAAAPVLLGVAGSTFFGATKEVVSTRIGTGSWEGVGEAALEGAASGFAFGGTFALGGSIIGGVARIKDYADSGLVIGKMPLNEYGQKPFIVEA